MSIKDYKQLDKLAKQMAISERELPRLKLEQTSHTEMNYIPSNVSFLI